MSVQSEIDRIITAVGNAYSKVSEKGGTVPASQTVANLATAIDSIPSGGAKETWVIKSSAAGVFATTQISFTSNGQKFTSIGAVDDGLIISLMYDNNEIANFTQGASAGFEFYNEAYRKITFDTPPTGALLTWLQANGVKQPDNTAVQNTKAVTITSNGTVSVTPDAPYDGLSSVDVTVDVSGSGGGSVGAVPLCSGSIQAFPDGNDGVNFGNVYDIFSAYESFMVMFVIVARNNRGDSTSIRAFFRNGYELSPASETASLVGIDINLINSSLENLTVSYSVGSGKISIYCVRDLCI